MVTLEICIDTPAGLEACRKGGADRIELCSALGLGGLTPSPGLMSLAAKCSVPSHAMIRPIPGGFDLNDDLVATMIGDIKAAKNLGLAGIVIGATTPDFQLDIQRMKPLIQEAKGMEITLHRAIDLCIDPLIAIDQAVELGITRILTSGGAVSAIEGKIRLSEMVKRAAGRITIMAGSGVTKSNVLEIIQYTGISDVHTSCSSTVPEEKRVSEMAFGPERKKITNADKIAEIRNLLSSSR